MKRYKITHDVYWDIIVVEDFQCEQDAVDILIDQLEIDGCEGCFLTQEDINSQDSIADEMYVAGGNHGRYLYHGGNFRVEAV